MGSRRTSLFFRQALVGVLLASSTLLVSLRGQGTDIAGDLASIREQFDLPGLAAIAFRWNELLAIGATGVRKQGAPESFTTADKVHLGSLTKSMTATLVAILVEDGKLGWDSTIGDLWGTEAVAPAYRGVSVRTLLRHRGGMPSNTLGPPWGTLMRKEGTEREQRERLVRGALALAPAYVPESKTQYANLHFAVAGALLERISDAPWERLMQERLFDPLKIKSVGYGPQASPGTVDQPWGHRPDGTPVAPEQPGSDNPPAIAPAGTAHCSLRDLARYGAFHLSRGKSAPGLLSRASFTVLHGEDNEAGDAWGLGWLRSQRPWAGGWALNHHGSNTMNLAVIWLAPEKNFGVAVATNIGGNQASAACNAVVSKLIAKFVTDPDS